MLEKLAHIFVERGIINSDTKVESEYYAKDLSGTNRLKLKDTFLVERVLRKNEKLILEVIRYDGFKTYVEAKDVLKIDGMEPERLAYVYNLKPDGTPRRLGKKRGRKSKKELARLQQMNESSIAQ